LSDALVAEAGGETRPRVSLLLRQRHEQATSLFNDADALADLAMQRPDLMAQLSSDMDWNEGRLAETSEQRLDMLLFGRSDIGGVQRAERNDPLKAYAL